jgi:hypothetical protein
MNFSDLTFIIFFYFENHISLILVFNLRSSDLSERSGSDIKFPVLFNPSTSLRVAVCLVLPSPAVPAGSYLLNPSASLRVFNPFGQDGVHRLPCEVPPTGGRSVVCRLLSTVYRILFIFSSRLPSTVYCLLFFLLSFIFFSVFRLLLALRSPSKL